MPNPLENQMLLYYLSGIGGALGGEGSVASAIGGITQQQIQTQNFQKLLKTLLAGGGKFSMDKEGVNLKAPTSAFRDTDLAIPGADDSLSSGGFSTGIPYKGMMKPPSGITGNMGGVSPTPRSELETLNPSASPLDASGADLAGLTPDMISQALQLKFARDEFERKTISDLMESVYRDVAIKKMQAETAAITPSIDIGGGTKLTQKQFIDWYKASTKDERTAAFKNYEAAKAEGYEGNFEDWMMSLAKAAGGIPEFAAKRRIGKEIDIESELSGPDFAQSVREDLMKDRDKWGYPPSFDSLVKKGYSDEQALDMGQKLMTVQEMDARIRSFYKGKKVERKQDGWYIDGKLKVRNPYAGK